MAEKRHKHHRSRKEVQNNDTFKKVVIGVIAVLVILASFCGITGFALYNSANAVKADAAEVMKGVASLKDQLLEDDPDKANATAQDIAKSTQHMKDETSGWQWTVGSIAPVYGSDIAKVKAFANTFDKLADDALVPLVRDLSDVSMDDLLADKSINIDEAKKAVDALANAAPVIGEATEKIDALGDAKLDQVKEPLEKAQAKLDELNAGVQFVAGIAPSFLDMVGVDGGPKTYVIVAQNNSEIRSTGGFLGSIGALHINDGKIEMGDFRSVYDIYPGADNPAPITDEELEIFGNHVGWQIADSNFIPDFARVSEIVKYAWERKGYEKVDGVIGVDPIFLQHMLDLVGGITTDNGTEVNGDNAAKILLHDAYYIEDPSEQDDFFEEVAAKSFEKFMDNLGKVPLSKMADILGDDIAKHRLQVWMLDEEQEAAIETIGMDGKLSHDRDNPTLGIYFVDESYSKLFWYLKSDVEVGEPVEHPDGSRTYPVTVTYQNMIDDVDEIPQYARAHNYLAETPGGMLCWVMVSAPEGAKVSGFKLLEGQFVPEDTHWRDNGSPATGDMSESTLQGLDFWYGFTHTEPGETFKTSFYVTCPPDIKGDLKVVTTPTAQEAAGW